MPDALQVAAGFQERFGGFKLQGDARQALRQGVVDLARQPVAFFECAHLRAAGEQPGALDGNAEHVSEGVQQPQVLIGQLAPVGAGDVQDPQLPLAGIQRDAGMVAQPPGAVHQLLQPAAGDHVDVRRPVHIARPVGIQAVARALHKLWVVDQAGRQVLRGGQVSVSAVVIHQPDPAGMQAEQLGRLG